MKMSYYITAGAQKQVHISRFGSFFEKRADMSVDPLCSQYDQTVKIFFCTICRNGENTTGFLSKMYKNKNLVLYDLNGNAKSKLVNIIYLFCAWIG